MQVVKIKEKKDKISFEKAHTIANEKAQSVLGDHLNIAFYNGDSQLVSPTLTSCFLDEWEDCGAEAYARANGAELLVDFDNRFKFFYRNVTGSYEEPSPSPFTGYKSANPYADLGV